MEWPVAVLCGKAAGRLIVKQLSDCSNSANIATVDTYVKRYYSYRMTKSASATTRESEERRGIRSTSFKFSPEEMELLDEAAELAGGRKAAVMAGLRSFLAKTDVSKEELIVIINKHFK